MGLILWNLSKIKELNELNEITAVTLKLWLYIKIEKVGLFYPQVKLIKNCN